MTVSVEERSRWSARAQRFRYPHRNWCQLCEKRTITIWGLTFKAKLEVHHIPARGWLWPVGQEPDSALMVVCLKCHDWITARAAQLARMRGHVISNPAHEGYSGDTLQATEEAVRRLRTRWVRGWRRTLRGLP